MGCNTFFHQECPTCGRTLRIRVEYLGRLLNCPHCRGRVNAADPESPGKRPAGLNLLERADELLATAEARSNPAARSFGKN